MAQLRDIKRHITSVHKIQQITKAMYAISMTRVMKAKQQLERARVYQRGQARLLRAVLDKVEPDHPLLRADGDDRYLFVINADRGLCGRFKGDLNRAAERLAQEGHPRVRLVLGGEKAQLYFRKSPFAVEREYLGLYDQPRFAHAQRIAQDLLDLYRQGGGAVQAVYMRFINDFRQVVEVAQLLPLDPAALPTEEQQEEALYQYEPSQQGVFEALVPMVLRAQVYRMLLESKTSEHAIRRQAMRNATDNADELIHDLTIEYNKARQEAITKQLFDIMGGAEALKQV